jgi:1-acyl-sn-glycerol-3-phosphate acyltransferase
MKSKNNNSSKIPREITPQDIEANKFIYNEYFDLSLGKSINKNIFDLIAKVYFRAKAVGFDKIPERNKDNTPLIFISNHSGMAFPWDAIVMASQYNELCEYDHRSIRALTAPALSKTPIMNPYLFRNLWKKGGGIDATTLNFETMMLQKEHNILIFPEGVPGIGKGFSKKYQLQKFSTSFVRMAIKHKADVIPYVTVNGEYINPYSYKVGFLDKLAQTVGVPYLPIGLATLLIPFQPWIFYMGFPSRLTYVMCKRIKLYERVNKPFEEISREEFTKIAKDVRKEVQEQLDIAVKEHGKKPFDLVGLERALRKNTRRNFPAILPIFWPVIFGEYERRLGKEKPEDIHMKLDFLSLMKYLFRNPFTFCYYIPILGWLGLIIKNMMIRK